MNRLSPPDASGITPLISSPFIQEFAHLHAQYETRLHALESQMEDILDSLALKNAVERHEESFPSSLVDALLSGKKSRVLLFRTYRGLTQSELAQRSGVRQGLLSEIESGKKKGSIQTLKSLAIALDIDVDHLI